MDYSTDISLIIETCKTTQDEAKIQKLIQSIMHWDEFIDLAYAHGVFPLVYRTLKTFTDIIPSTVLQNMKLYNMDIVKENMLMTAELIKIMKLLEENNIEAIAFKGPTLSQMAYGDITLRQYADIDLLIKPEKFLNVYDKLIKLKFTTEHDYDKATYRILELIPDHMFIHPKNGIQLEIHNKLFASNFPIFIDDTIFWKNQKSIIINNISIPTFSNEYLLFYLCLHGSKHLFARISWILDIAKMIETQNKELDWGLFIKLVQKYKLNTMVKVGLELAVKLFGTKIPKNVMDKLAENKRIHSIITKIEENLLHEPEETERFTFTHLMMFDSLSEKIKYSTYLLKPTVQDYQTLNIKHNYLYYILRPFSILLRKD